MRRKDPRVITVRSAATSILLGVTAVAAATPTASAQEPAQADEWRWPERAENLQALPADFPGSRLRAVMTGFTRALGVRCSHCHVGEEGRPLSTYDFPSDENPNKVTARVMLDLLGAVNDHLDRIEPSGERVNMWCHTCHRGRPRPQTLGEAILETYRAEGLEAAVASYRDIRARFYGAGAYDFSERSLDGIGRELLGAGEPEAAVAFFRLNVEQFPESAAAHYRLAEGYVETDRPELAIIHLQRSLELDPENARALSFLRELKP